MSALFGTQTPAPAGDPQRDCGPAGAGLPAQLLFTAYGQPKPKGSLRHIGRGRMVEQLEGSEPWRVAVASAARAAMLESRWAVRTAGPIEVTAAITVPKPASAPKRRRIWPVTRSSGDLDKHVRNILDALTDAAVFGDDSQVVVIAAHKCYLGDQGALDAPGALITVRVCGD
ncbi:MAG: RusA family crossover junction endodeoxyribonuclease [Sporichthyaceae bacterium]|nr:RusA family crossover junction endodeoxyribonuclease [Sporichthyaceae bacterium]